MPRRRTTAPSAGPSPRRAHPPAPDELRREDATVAAFHTRSPDPAPPSLGAVLRVPAQARQPRCRRAVVATARRRRPRPGRLRARQLRPPARSRLPDQASDRATESVATGAEADRRRPPPTVTGVRHRVRLGPRRVRQPHGSATGPVRDRERRRASTPRRPPTSPGLCKAYQATDRSDDGKSLDSAAFTALADGGRRRRQGRHLLRRAGRRAPRPASRPTSRPRRQAHRQADRQADADRQAHRQADRASRPAADAHGQPDRQADRQPTDKPSPGKPTDKPDHVRQGWRKGLLNVRFLTGSGRVPRSKAQRARISHPPVRDTDPPSRDESNTENASQRHGSPGAVPLLCLRCRRHRLGSDAWVSRGELSAQEDTNRRMLRARDEMDRRYAEPLDVPTLAAIAHLSASQFGRVFKDVYGETPHRYLQRRRVERAMTLLRQTDRPVTDVAWDVGFASLGTFSRTFSNIVGLLPDRVPRPARAGRRAVVLHRGVDAAARAGAQLRDSRFGEAGRRRRWLASSS